MIGRGALGNPWFIKNTVNYLENKEIITPSPKEKIEMIKKNFKYLLENKPERLAILEMRTLASYYLKGLPNGSEAKQKIFKANTKDEFLNIINEIESVI